MLICLLIASIYDLDLQSADIENAYLTAPCREKIRKRADPKFGQDEGKLFIIVMALYGLKSSGSAFREFISEQLDEMGFRSSISDPNLWIRPVTRPYGKQYYEFILVYVHNLIAIIQNAVSVIREVLEKN